MAARRIEWLGEAKADIRRLDRDTAMRIFEGVLHFARTGEGDVKKLQGRFAGSLRLRLGNYRVIFSASADAIRISGVRHRKEAYR